jgi:cytochrome P450
VYLVTPHATVKALFRDSVRYPPPVARQVGRGLARDALPAETARLYDDINDFLRLFMTRMTGDVHRRVRSASGRGFMPRRMEEYVDMVGEIVDDLLEPLEEQESTDLVEFAYRFPLHVIMAIFDAPREDGDQLKRWGDALITFATMRPTDPEQVHLAHEQLEQFRAYADDLIRRTRGLDSHGSLVASLLDANEDDRLEYDELVATFMFFLLAGHETTRSLIANGLALLMAQPEQWAKLCSDPSLTESAVEEALRCDPSIPSTTRIALEPAVLHGVEVPAGSMVILSLAAANRDPAVFDNPDRFDITRSPNDHLAFAYGPHFCLGAPLARLEGKIALTELATRFPDLALAVDPGELEWFGLPYFHALKKLPVTLTAPVAPTTGSRPGARLRSRSGSCRPSNG